MYELPKDAAVGAKQDDDVADDDDTDGIDLNTLLAALDVKNVWKDQVPKRFLAVVFSSAHRRLLSMGEAKALCDLFQANYDLVRAAWEVYLVQNDPRDFVDTLRRIVRDLTFNDDGDIRMSGDSSIESAGASGRQQGTAKALASTARQSVQAAAVAKSDARPSQGPSSSSSSSEPAVVPSSSSAALAAHPQHKDIKDAMAANEADKQRILAQKREAMASIQNAKRDLLRHSLEMMVKQGVVSGEGASNLFERSLHGDALVDAAIDA